MIFMQLFLSVGKQRNIELRSHTKRKGMKLNRYGLFKNNNRIKKKFKNINEIIEYIKYK